MPRRGKAPSRELLAKIFSGNYEMIKEFEKLYDTDGDEQEQIDAINVLIKNITEGAGLGSAGQYLIPSGTNYLDATTSLADATERLDEILGNVANASGFDTEGNYIIPTGTNYIDTSTDLTSANLLLDEAIFINTRTLIINQSANYQALAGNQLILCDAISGAFDITLPDPTLSLVSGVSIEVGITKIDTSVNIVTILPFASEKIVGEDSQDLQLDAEVLNFITDGTNWYLRN